MSINFVILYLWYIHSWSRIHFMVR